MPAQHGADRPARIVRRQRLRRRAHKRIRSRLQRIKPDPPARPRRGKRARAAGVNPVGNPLFEALRAKRREIAQETGVPPYVIFHDSVLRDMALVRPATLSALGELSGVGARKLEAYGAEFLQVIREAS